MRLENAAVVILKRSRDSLKESDGEMNQSAKFWDKIAERYSRRPIADEAAYRKKLQVTREYLRPDMQVLEFGCGTGSTAIEHAPYVNHIQAIDISSKMIDIARTKAAAKSVANITFEQATIDEFSVPDQSLDAVLGLSILHLLDNREDVIARVYRMLKRDGVFVTSTICLGDTMMRLFALVVPLGRFFGLMPLVRVFTAKELVTSLTDAGFQIDYQWQPGNDKAAFIVAKKTK